MKFIALIHPDKIGPAYGIGQSLEEARARAFSSGFKLGDWVAVEITGKAYHAISTMGPSAVDFHLSPLPLEDAPAVSRFTWTSALRSLMRRCSRHEA